MTELNKLTLADARDKLRAKEVTSVELTQSCIDAIEKADVLNAYAHKTPEIALEQAKAADARIAEGDAPAMCGLPVGIKDLFCTKGVPSQAASAILEGFKPEYESTITSKLFDAGSVMLGKLNMANRVKQRISITLGGAVMDWEDGRISPSEVSYDILTNTAVYVHQFQASATMDGTHQN